MAHRLNTPKQGTVSENVFLHLKARLEKLEWQPGERLPSVRHLAQSYGVAPLTMSKVIRRLVDAQLVTSQPGKGIYAVELPMAAAGKSQNRLDPSWQLSLLRRQPPRSFSVTLPQGLPANAINLSTGTMSNEAVPLESLRRAIRRTARTYVEGPVWERSPQGEQPLRQWFAENFHRIGVSSTAESNLIVSSTHQAFRIIAASIIEPGDVVIIEQPSDPIVMGVFELAGAHCVAVDIDHDGIVINQLEEAVERHRPKAIVTCSSGQVPTGVTMALSRRKDLVRIAAESRTLIVEYDNGNEVYFDSPPPPPIKSLDDHGVVVLVHDVSRVTMAGFRVGCLTLQGPLLQRLIDSKRRDDLLTSTLAQYALLDYVTGPDYKADLRRLRAFYRPRRDATLRALQLEMPGSVTWTVPNVGFHVWLTLPTGVSARMVANEAALRGVIVAPSEIFSLDGHLDTSLRVTYSTNPPETIAIGIKRLAEAVRTVMSTDQPARASRTFEVV